MVVLIVAYFTKVRQIGGGRSQLARQVHSLERERSQLQEDLALKEGEVNDLTGYLEQERRQNVEHLKKLEQVDRVIKELKTAGEEAHRRKDELKKQLPAQVDAAAQRKVELGKLNEVILPTRGNFKQLRTGSSPPMSGRPSIGLLRLTFVICPGDPGVS